MFLFPLSYAHPRPCDVTQEGHANGIDFSHVLFHQWSRDDVCVTGHSSDRSAWGINEDKCITASTSRPQGSQPLWGHAIDSLRLQHIYVIAVLNPAKSLFLCYIMDKSFGLERRDFRRKYCLHQQEPPKRRPLSELRGITTQNHRDSFPSTHCLHHKSN
jgi:hypothetical protein